METAVSSLNRTNSDKSINNYGYKLIDFCKLNSMYIINGRPEGDNSPGACKCKKVSCINYLCVPVMFCQWLNA